MANRSILDAKSGTQYHRKTLLSVSAMIIIGGLVLVYNSGKMFPMSSSAHPNNLASQFIYEVPLINRSDNITKMQQFDVSRALLNRLEIPPKNFVHLTKETLEDFAFVTGASENHFLESKGLVACIQQHFPDKKLVYYDLGLSVSNRQEIQNWCQVEMVTFPYSAYPEHVRDLHTYAFKPLIIQSLFKKYSGAIWMDSSIRFTADFRNVFAKVVERGGIYLPIDSGVPTFITTDTQIYQYLLPNNMTREKTFRQRGAGVMLVYRTEEAYWGILHWWFLCALQEHCIAPPGHEVHCGKWRKCYRNGWATCWAGCHRYDQTAINILYSNYFSAVGQINLLVTDPNITLKIKRTSRNPAAVQIC